MSESKPRTTGVVGVLTVALFLYAIVSSLIVFQSARLLGASIERSPLLAFLLPRVTLQLGFLIIGYLYIRHVSGLQISVLPSRNPVRSPANVVLLVTVVLIGSAIAVSNPFDVLDRYIESELPVRKTFSILAVGGIFLIAAPLAEEFVFRCVIQQRLQAAFSISTSILVTSLIFSLFHFGSARNGTVVLFNSLLILGLSLVYGTVYARTESLLPAALVHAVYNGLVYLGVLLRL